MRINIHTYKTDWEEVPLQNFLILGKYYNPIITELFTPLINKYKTDDTLLMVQNNTDVANCANCIKYKPFFGKKWIVLVNYNSLDATGQTTILKLIKETFQYAYILIYVAENSDIFRLSKSKEFLSSKSVGIINTYFFHEDLYKKYINQKINGTLEKKALNLMLKYIHKDIDNLEHYINNINSYNFTVVDTSIIKKLIPDLRTYTVDNYIETLLLLNRKTVHMKALDIVLRKYGFKKSLGYIKYSINVCIALKKLMYSGDLAYTNTYEDISSLKKVGNLPRELTKCSFKRIKLLSEIVVNIPLNSLILIKMLFLSVKTEYDLLSLTAGLANRNDWSPKVKEYYNLKLLGK